MGFESWKIKNKKKKHMIYNYTTPYAYDRYYRVFFTKSVIQFGNKFYFGKSVVSVVENCR